MFCEWQQPQQREAAQSLMKWLADTSKQVFQEDLILDYGPDCLRLYLLFEKTPQAQDSMLDTWEECSLEGLYKFLGRFRRLILVTDWWNRQGGYTGQSMEALLAEVAQLRCDMLAQLAKGNTMPNRHNAVSVLMTGTGRLQKELDTGTLLRRLHSHDVEAAVPHYGEEAVVTATPDKQVSVLCRELLILLAPFAPHLAEELWQTIRPETAQESIMQLRWQCEHLPERSIALPIQVDSRTRRVIQVSQDCPREECLALAEQAVRRYLEPQSTYRCIYVPQKIVNYVKDSE